MCYVEGKANMTAIVSKEGRKNYVNEQRLTQEKCHKAVNQDDQNSKGEIAAM